MPRYLTEEDWRAYGPELIDMTGRAARDALAPELEDVKRRQYELAAREQRLQNQTVFNALDKALPNWRAVNNDPNFLAFLAQSEELSGRQAHTLLLEAFSQGQVGRILAFFNAYLAATGQTPAPQVSAPSSAQARPQAPAPGKAQTINATIGRFYDDVRKGRWPDQKARDAEERRLHQIAHQHR